MLAHAVIQSLIYRECIVVVLRTVHPALRDVQVYAVITGLGNLHSIFFEGLNAQSISLTTAKTSLPAPYLEASLLLCTIVHAPGNYVPPAVHIGDVAPPKWARGRQGQL